MTERQRRSRGVLGRRLGVIIGFLAVSTLGVASAAAATSPDLPDEGDVIAFFEENMDRFEVPQELRASLIEKALNGEALDADLPGAVAVSTDTVTNEYGTYPVKRYSDGSFDSEGVAEPVSAANGDVSARALKDCNETGSPSGQAGTCQAYHWTLWHNMWYYFDYEWTASGTSEIVAMYERGFDSGDSCHTEEFGPYQQYGSVGNPAKGKWTMTCTDVVGSSKSKSLGVRSEPFKVVWTVQDY